MTASNRDVVRSKNHTSERVPVAEIRALHAEVERTHDAYWVEDYDHASVNAHHRRRAWLTAVEAYETALKQHAPALLDAYEHKGK